MLIHDVNFDVANKQIWIIILWGDDFVFIIVKEIVVNFSYT